MTCIDLIAGLGNPGSDYEQTRHNAGFWFVEAIARAHGGQFRKEAKFQAEVCKIRLDGHEVWLLKPMNYMNHSGQAVSALCRFYKIPLERVLVAHDELDIDPGGVRLKKGGGHAGHNGLRDIIACSGGSKDFLRLRLGIGHPGQSSQVSNYVLGRAGKGEQQQIDQAIDAAVDALPMIVAGELQKAMNELHSK